MAVKITIEQAAAISEGAFRPLECVAEVRDYRFRLGFRVYGPENEFVLTVEDLTAPQVTDPRRLQHILEEARARVQKLGHTLSDWDLPELRSMGACR